jgi:hypothetical protein
MSVTLDCTCAPLVRCRKKRYYILTAAALVARIANEAMVGSGGVSVWRDPVTVAVNVYTFDLTYKDIL